MEQGKTNSRTKKSSAQIQVRCKLHESERCIIFPTRNVQFTFSIIEVHMELLERHITTHALVAMQLQRFFYIKSNYFIVCFIFSK